MSEEKEELPVEQDTEQIEEIVEEINDEEAIREQLAQQIAERSEQADKTRELALETYKSSPFLKEKMIIGFTGHRPDKLYRRLAKRVANDYLKVHKDKIEYVVNGGCRGWDIEILTHCQRLGIPYKIFLAFEEDKRYIPEKVRADALEITLEKKRYSSDKDKRHYHTRNRKIVQACDELHAYLRKQDGGTVSTVLYAKEHSNKVIFNWFNLTYLQVPNGLDEVGFMGHKLYWFKELLNRLGKSLYR